MKTNIISVKYEDKFMPKTFSGRAYNYITQVNVEIGDFVIAPTIHGDKIARVSETNISETKIEQIRQYLKTITHKINKIEYLYNNQVKEVA